MTSPGANPGPSSGLTALLWRLMWTPLGLFGSSLPAGLPAWLPMGLCPGGEPEALRATPPGLPDPDLLREWSLRASSETIQQIIHIYN